MHSLHVLSLRHVVTTWWQNVPLKRSTPALRVLTPLRQQHYNLSFPSLYACVCVCARARVCVCVSAHIHVRVRCGDVLLSVAAAPLALASVSVVVYCVVFHYPRLNHWVLNWNFVLLWVDYESTHASRSSAVSCVKYDYRYIGDRAEGVVSDHGVVVMSRRYNITDCLIEWLVVVW